MLEIEALEREAEKKEERAKEGGEKGEHEHNLSSPMQPPPPPLGPSMALGESDEDDDDEEDGEDEEEEGGERERPIRLTNHTCESCDPESFPRVLDRYNVLFYTVNIFYLYFIHISQNQTWLV